MRIIKTLFPNLFFIFLSINLFSQIAIDQWRDHLPYHSTISVADAGEKIYCATPYSLFYYDKTDYSINRLTKVNGLSDIGISAIAFNKDYNTLLIAYTNTNIDLIKGNVIINISDIKRKPILGNKTINNILFIDSLAYLACGFGIVVLDIKNEEFPEPTYYIGPDGSQVNVMDLTIGKDTLYAATESGIYKADYNNPNLANYEVWSVDQKLFPNALFNVIQYFENRLIVNNNNEGYHTDTLYLYDYDSQTWGYFPDMNNYRKYSLKIVQGKFIIVSDGKVEEFNSNFERIISIYQPGGVYLDSRDATIDDEENSWIADFKSGLIKTHDGTDGEFISPNGPWSVNIFDMSLKGNDLWVASGGRTSDWGKMYIGDGVYSFVGEQWNSYNRHTGYNAFDSISDMVCVAVDPLNPKRVYVGNWRNGGVMEFLNGEIAKIYDDKNSSLEKWPAAGSIAISGLAFDNNNNLWVANSGAPSLVSVKEPNGTWTSFSLGASVSGTYIGKMVIDSYNQKWIKMRADNSLLVFTENGTISDPTDDKVKILSNAAGNGALPGNRIFSMAQDLDGEMWLGSDEGIGVIYSPENIFTDGNFDAQKILVEIGGYVQYLLESESVTAIAIDGDNRKWAGTERAGVFLFSPDGTEEIHHFTEDNSPLYSNSIIDIEINGITGEVFFATDRGLISYKSTATNGGDTNKNVVVYPNPVREGYSGAIAIKGLVKNADVKITDISGTLIFATKAEGGQAIWNGRNFSGSKAKTGVYIVFATNKDGNEKIVAKILFIN